MTDQSIQELAASLQFRGEKLKVHLVETHISWVLIGDEFVFKIKKPVKLPFLDFTRIEQRQFYCKREVELNSRLCDIYLDVQSICKTNGSWEIGPDCRKLTDYAVLMRQCEPSRRMDKLLDKDQVGEKHMLQIADQLAPFHRKAEVVHGFDLKQLDENYNDLGSISDWAGSTLGNDYKKHVEEALELSKQFLGHHQKRMQERSREDFYRDVHGDLHSGNIFLTDPPVIFDCIEFNDSFRQIDVLNELAFFCMDLEFFGKQELAGNFLKSYLEQNPVMPQAEDRKIFTYYKTYRANVRAKVMAYAARKDSKNAEAMEKAAHYLQLLHSYWQELKSGS